jgi:HlyD family secretion protein
MNNNSPNTAPATAPTAAAPSTAPPRATCKPCSATTKHPPAWKRPALWIGLAMLLVAAGGVCYSRREMTNAAPVYVTEALKKGKLTLTVAATAAAPTRSVSIPAASCRARSSVCWWT